RQTQGFGLSAFDLLHRQQFADFKSCLGLLLLDGQHALRVFVKPERSHCANWQTVGMFHASSATENASHAPKLWSRAAIYAPTLALSRSYVPSSFIRHHCQMLMAMRMARGSFRRTSKVGASTTCQTFISMPPGVPVGR